MAEYTAAGLSPAQIQAASDLAVEGDTVVMPAGTYSGFNATVYIPAGVSLRGAGVGNTVLTATAGAVPFFYFNDTRATTTYTVEIQDFKLIGNGIDTGTGYALRIKTLPEIIIHDIWLEYKSSVLLAIDGCTKGVIYNSTFKWCINRSSYGSGGYGIAVKGTYPYTWPGSYPALGTENAIFIENNTFYGCRHAIQGQDCANYVARYNTISGGWGHGQIDIHGARDTEGENSSGLQWEIYQNTITLDTNPLEPNFTHSPGTSLRGGHGVCYSNKFISDPQSTTDDTVWINDTDILAHTAPVYVFATHYPILWQPRDIYDWGNTYGATGTETPVNVYESSTWFQLDRESTNSMGTFKDYQNIARVGYTAYTYPHPLRGSVASFPDNWDGRKSATVDHTNIDSDLTGFPLLAKFTDDSDIGTYARSDGADIRFADVNGNLLPHEKLTFSVAGGLATGIYYVNAALAGAANTTLYVYYNCPDAADADNPTNVWDANYMMVQHMTDATTSTTLDSTANNNDGTKKGAAEPAVSTTAKIYRSQDYDDTDDYLNCASGATLDNLAAYTWEAWLYIDSWPAVDIARILSKELISGNNQYLAVRNALHRLVAAHGASTTAASSTGTTNELSLTTWQWIVHTFDNAGDRKIDLSINNTEVTYVTQTAMVGTIRNDSADKLVIGNREDGARPISSKLEEVRVSNIVRPAAWLKFQYANVTETDNELAWGAHEPTANLYGVGASVSAGSGSLTVTPPTVQQLSSAMDNAYFMKMKM